MSELDDNYKGSDVTHDSKHIFPPDNDQMQIHAKLIPF